MAGSWSGYTSRSSRPTVRSSRALRTDHRHRQDDESPITLLFRWLRNHSRWGEDGNSDMVQSGRASKHRRRHRDRSGRKEIGNERFEGDRARHTTKESLRTSKRPLSEVVENARQQNPHEAEQHHKRLLEQKQANLRKREETIRTMFIIKRGDSTLKDTHSRSAKIDTGSDVNLVCEGVLKELNIEPYRHHESLEPILSTVAGYCRVIGTEVIHWIDGNDDNLDHPRVLSTNFHVIPDPKPGTKRSFDFLLGMEFVSGPNAAAGTRQWRNIGADGLDTNLGSTSSDKATDSQNLSYGQSR